MKKYRRVLLYTFLLTVIVCGITVAISVSRRMPNDVSIRGTVTRGGQPLEWTSATPRMTVVFIPENHENAFLIYPADCHAKKGTFTIAKIPTGRYTVAVQINDSPTDSTHRQSDQDIPIIREVTEDGQVIGIDLPLRKSGPQ